MRAKELAALMREELDKLQPAASVYASEFHVFIERLVVRLEALDEKKHRRRGAAGAARRKAKRAKERAERKWPEEPYPDNQGA